MRGPEKRPLSSASAAHRSRQRNRNRNRARDDGGERQARGLIRRRGCQIKRDGPEAETDRPTRPGRRRVAGITSAARHGTAPRRRTRPPGACHEERGHFAGRDSTRRRRARRRSQRGARVPLCPLPASEPRALVLVSALVVAAARDSDSGRSPPSPPVPDRNVPRVLLTDVVGSWLGQLLARGTAAPWTCARRIGDT